MIRALTNSRRLLTIQSTAPFSSAKKQQKDSPETEFQKGLERNRRYDPIRSLFYEYQNIKDATFTDLAIQNKKNVYEGFMSADGPKLSLTADKIRQINALADAKLIAMSESGLTREDILGIKPKPNGPRPKPLYKDAFFQTILKDHSIRNNLIKDTEEYSVSRIVALALRQDLGPDRSMVASGKRLIEKTTGHNQEQGNLPAFHNKPAEVADYYLSETTPSPYEYRTKEFIEAYKPFLKSPQKNPPPTKINRRELHWRNTEYLCNFLSNFAHIKHKRVTGFTNTDQRNVSRVIKHSQTLGLLPRMGYIKPHHRQSLKTLEHEIENDVRFVFDFEHGSVTKEDDEDLFGFRTHHFSLSHGHVIKTDLNQDLTEAKKLEAAAQLALHQKAEGLREAGVDIEKGLEGSQVRGVLTVGVKAEKLTEEELENGKRATEELRERYHALAEEDLLSCVVSEYSRNIDQLERVKALSAPKTVASSADAEDETYATLLAKIKSVKEAIQSNKVNLGASTFDNTRIKNIAKSVQQLHERDL